MDLRQLAYVVAIEDHGGFTRAAEAMHVAQPSLSQAVRSLEAELGVELFHRSARRVVLTAAGEALLGPARQALRDAETARAAVADVAGLAAGRLDLVSLPTLAVDPAAGLIGAFRRAHPGIAVRLVEPEDAAAVAGRVREGTSELGFAELPVAEPSVESHELEAQEFVALVPAALAAERTSSRWSLRSLARQPIVTTPPGTSTRRQIDEALADLDLRIEVAVETDHREAIGPLVRAGAGVAVLPRLLADQAANRQAVVREVTPRIVRRVGIIHRPGPLSPAAHAFLALALGQERRPRERPAPRRRRP